MSMYCNIEFECMQQWIVNKFCTDVVSLKILQLNIRGMNDLAKFDGVREMLQQYGERIDVLVLGETFLKADRTCIYNLDGYIATFSCRNESSGGLAVFVRNDIDMDVLENRTADGFHHIHCQLRSLNKRIDCHAVYRPPSFGATRFLDEMDQILSKTKNGHDCIIVGDMNIPVNKPSINIVQQYSHLLSSYGMVVTNTFVTRPASGNILDHVICDEKLSHSVTNETIPSDLSDHCVVLSTFRRAEPILKRTLEKQIIDHRRLNQLFFDRITTLPQTLTADQKLSHVINCYNTLLPQCTRTVKAQVNIKGHCPWMTLHLWKLIQIKDNTLKRKRRNPNDAHLSELLAHVSKKLQKEKAECKRNYYSNQLSSGDQKASWKVINEAMGKNSSRAYPTELLINGNKTTDSNQIAQHFNDFFSNVGPNLAATINSDREVHKFGTLSALPEGNSLFLRPASINETIALINALNPKKSPGPDGIPASFLKANFVFFAHLLTDVFNEIVETGVYPAVLKVARVTPVHKSGDKKEANNYRPISCLSILDKVIEKLIVSRLVDFITQHKLLYAHQYGFRQGLSTLSASCNLVDDIYDSLDKRELVGALFIDLKKAFDTIDHRLLLEKLETYGIRGVAKAVIESYLSDRLQFVSLGQVRSTLSPVITGVPQGSNLGPILFLLFINDIGKLKLKGTTRLFADDTSVFYHGKDCALIQRQITQDLELLDDYFQTNLLSMNLSKTKYMLIRSPRKQLPARQPIVFNGQQIEEVNQYPFLGLTLDDTMSWLAHIDLLKKKLAPICGILWKLSSFLPTSCLKKLYFSLVHSRLNYLVTTWGLAYAVHLHDLQVIQNRCIKAVFRKPYLYPTSLLYSNPADSLLPLRALQKLQMLTHVRKCHLSTTTASTFPIREQTSENDRATRQLGDFILPLPRTEFGMKRVAYVGCKLHNELPTVCKNASQGAFKLSLRNHIKSKIIDYLV